MPPPPTSFCVTGRVLYATDCQLIRSRNGQWNDECNCIDGRTGSHPHRPSAAIAILPMIDRLIHSATCLSRPPSLHRIVRRRSGSMDGRTDGRTDGVSSNNNTVPHPLFTERSPPRPRPRNATWPRTENAKCGKRWPCVCGPPRHISHVPQMLRQPERTLWGTWREEGRGRSFALP